MPFGGGGGRSRSVTEQIQSATDDDLFNVDNGINADSRIITHANDEREIDNRVITHANDQRQIDNRDLSRTITDIRDNSRTNTNSHNRVNTNSNNRTDITSVYRATDDRDVYSYWQQLSANQTTQTDARRSYDASSDVNPFEFSDVHQLVETSLVNNQQRFNSTTTAVDGRDQRSFVDASAQISATDDRDVFTEYLGDVTGAGAFTGSYDYLSTFTQARGDTLGNGAIGGNYTVTDGGIVDAALSAVTDIVKGALTLVESDRARAPGSVSQAVDPIATARPVKQDNQPLLMAGLALGAAAFLKG